MTEVAALPPVAADLMIPPGKAKCHLPERDDYDPREVLAYGKCYNAAYDAMRRRLIGLQRAVKVREQAAAKAVKASNL